MKKKHLLSGFIAIVLFIPGHLTAQDTTDQLLRLTEMQAQLLQKEVELLEIRAGQLKQEQQSLASDISKMTVEYNKARDSLVDIYGDIDYKEQEPILPHEYRTVLYFDPFRLFEGTLLLGYERALNDKFAIDISALGTYMTEGGMGSGYLSKQELAAYNVETDSYDNYTGESITSWGFILKAKNYLTGRVRPDKKAPLGLYAAPQFMYRRAFISGVNTTWVDGEYIEEEVKQNLNIYSFGVILGGKFVIMKVFSVDLYIGGLMRLSKYDNESGFTTDSDWNSIDYSGVLPTAGISLGILK